MKNKYLNFTTDKFDVQEIDDRFLRLEIWMAVVGDNRNGSHISKEAYELSKPTIEYIPVCGAFNGRDFKEHSPSESPLGFVFDCANNNYRYEIGENGLEYIVVDALIFKDYCQEQAEVIENSGIKKVSMEILVDDYEVDENDKLYINKFTYKCCTVLGDNYTEAMPGAKLKVKDPKRKYSKFIKEMQFALNKENTEEFLEKEDTPLENQEEELKVNENQEVDMSKENEDVKCSENQEQEMSEQNKEEVIEENQEQDQSEKADYQVLFNEITEKYSTLQEEFKTFKEEKSVEIESMSKEISELKEFKANIEEQDRKDKLEFALNSVSEDLSPDQIDEWRQKSSEYSNVDDFKNAIEAFAYSVTKSKKSDKQEFSRIHIPLTVEPKKESSSVWDRI